MGLFNHFPYPDTHQLNLDWILDAVKTCVDAVKTCVDKVTELWTYVREPGAGIQKALTDAQAAAESAQNSATNAQASAANARTSAIGAEANAANAQTSANDAETSAQNAQDEATTAQTSAQSAQEAATAAQTSAQSAQEGATSAERAGRQAQTYAKNAGKFADTCAEYVAQVQAMMGNLYPIGAVYVNYRNQSMPVESDATVIARLQALTGGTWARAGSHGQPVTASEKLGWATVILGDGVGNANDTNFNIYVRTA